MRNMIEEKERLLDITFTGIDEEHVPGLYDWLCVNRPEIYSEIVILEEKIDENFKNSNTQEELKSLLREYWNYHMKAIEIYQQHITSIKGLKEAGA